MSDTDGKKPLGLRGGSTPGQVKQSFSHGRTKSVLVETKRKRIVVPTKPGAPAAGATPNAHLGDPSKRPAGISDSEMERRLKAVQAARSREVADTAQRLADEKSREEDRQRRRDENEAKEREVREAEAAVRAKLDAEDRARREAEIAAERAAAPKTDARPAQRTDARARPAAANTANPAPVAAPLGERSLARAPSSAPRKTDRERDAEGAKAKAKVEDSRRTGKLTLTEALAGDGGRVRSMAAMKFWIWGQTQ